MMASPAADALGPEHPVPIHRADGEACDVEVVGCHHPGVFRRLAADQHTSRLAAAVTDTFHHGGDPLRVHLPGCDVVEHEERFGPEADKVVDAHGHQIDTDGAVTAGGLGHGELGPHPVGRRHQHRDR